MIEKIPKKYRDAHRHCTRNKEEIANSNQCGCFYCQRIFDPSEINGWVDSKETTAICPYCNIDSVIGSASKLPYGDADFLTEMHKWWFDL